MREALQQWVLQWLKFTIFLHVWKAAYSVSFLLAHGSFKIDNNPIPGIYSGLFAIHLALHAIKRETDGSKPNITFYALCVLYVLTGAVVAINIAITSPSTVSNCIFFFSDFGLIQLCRMMSLQPMVLALLRPQYLVAAILSLSAFWYALLTILHSFPSSMLQRYTAAGLCTVKTSAS